MAMKSQSTSASFMREYLGRPLTKLHLNLSKNGNLSFHWADYALTCEVTKGLIKNDQSFRSYHGALVHNLDKMKAIPMWVKTVNGVTTLSLYDIYDFMATQGHVSNLYVNAEGKLVLSFHGPDGPFEVVPVLDLIHHDKYKEIIFTHLLGGKIPVRDFRVRCEGSILCYYDTCFNKFARLNVEQMTSEGLLFSTTENLKEKFSHSKEIRLLINLSVFQQTMKQSFVDIRNSFSDFKYNLFFTRDLKHSYHTTPGSLRFYQGHDYERTGLTYIFVSYSDIKGDNDIVETTLRQFCTKLQNHIKDNLVKKAA